MNFIGKFDAKLASDGFTADSHVHVEHPSAHAPADAIIVPDAHLLFGADFKRSGVDLILSNADRELVVHDYFKGEHRHPLASPDGAHLTGDIVNALTGHVQYAQAGTPDPVAHVIGHVTKLSGSATAVRNGVSVILNNGDNVEKGDVVATGSDSTLGVTFIDGTVFGLSSNARMVLNEMVYDPNGSNNSSLISLVAGTISFVAGETAKHGDMKVDTPVATMGIRGTAVLVEIDFNVPGQNGLPDAKFQVLVEPDGHTGSYILFDKTTLDPIATVNKAGQQVNINQNGISYTQSPLTPELQKLITDVFSQKFSNNDTNTKTFDHFTDSIVPQPFQGFKGPDNIIVQTVFLQTNSLGTGPSQNQGPSPNKGHVDVAPTVGASSDGTPELAGVTGSPNTDKATGFITFADVNLGDQPTASAVFHSFSYQDAQHHDISLNLTAAELAAVQAVEVALDITQDPSGLANGTAHWSYSVSDAALDFLGQDETLTLTYYVTVSNNFAQSIKTTTVPIEVTITGSNDVPKIDSVVPQTIAFLGGTSVAGGDLTAHVPTSGTILFDDPDLTDTHTVSVAAPTSTLTDPTTGITTAFTLPPTPLAIFDQALTASITDATTHLPTDSTGTGHGSVSWSLAELPVWLGDFIPKDEILTLTYAVTVTDSQNATATQDITVTITGTDTPAVVWIATTGTGPAPDGLWSTGANWETGNAPTFADDVIIITDQLEGLTPTYPVTITSAVGPGGAAANNLAMDNFGGSAPELINQDTLQVFGSFTIQDHSTDNPEGYVGPELNNQGTLTIDGALNLDNDAVLLNSGGIGLWGGGAFGGASTITNTGTGTIVVSGGTLNINVDIANSGQVATNIGGALTLSGAAINGGTIINDGTLTLNGNATVENGTLYNVNVMNVSGAGNALIDETIYANPIYLVPQLHSNPAKPVVPNPDSGDDGDDGGDTIVVVTTPQATIPAYTINVTGALILSGTTIDSGLITSAGTIDVTGNSAINAEMTGGQMAVETGVILTTDVTAIEHATITNKGTIEVDQNERLTLADVALTGGKIINSGAIEIVDTATFFGPNGAIIIDESGTIPAPAPATTTITGTTISNNLLTIDGGDTLALSGATIDGGAINDFSAGATSGSVVAGDIDVTGSSTISNAHLNNGDVTIGGNATLTLDGSTVTGTSFDDDASGATIQVDGGAANTLTLSGVHIDGGIINAFTGVSSGSVVAGDIDITGSSTISNAHLNNGNVTLGDNVALTLTNDTVAGASFADTAVGATIQIVGNTILDDVTISGGTLNNSGTIITIDGGQTLQLQDGVTVSGGTLSNSGTLDIESSTGATLNDVAITGGGAIQIDGPAPVTTTPLVLEGGTSITGGTLTVGATSGSLAIESAAGATLDHVGVTNDRSIEISSGSNLTLDDGTTVANGSGTLTVDGGATLTLNDAEITGGTINNSDSGGSGTVDVTGASKIDGNATLNGGNVQVGNATLTLDHVTVNGTSFDDIADGATIQIDGGVANAVTLSGVTINGGTINAFTGVSSGSVVAADIDVTGSSTISNAALNQGNVTLSENVTLTLDGSTVTGTSFDDTADGATIQIDGGDTLTLSGASINGGIINDFNSGPSGSIVAGDIDVTGSSTISNATLNRGNVTLGKNVTLTLDGSAVTGASFDDTAGGATIQVDGGDTLTLSGAMISGGTIDAFTSVSSGSVVAADIDIAGSSTLSNAVLNNGDVTLGKNVTLTLDGATVNGASFDDIASGATIDVTGTVTLNDVSINGGSIHGFATTSPGGQTVGDLIDISGSSSIGNAVLTADHVTLESGVTLTLDGSTVTAAFNDDASGATIQVDGGQTLTLDGASIIGGTVNDFSTDASGSIIAGDIDVKGDSTIAFAHVNHGDITLASDAVLTLDGSTITGTSFDDIAGGAVIQVDGFTGDTVTFTNVSINGGGLTVAAHGLVQTSGDVTLTGTGITNDGIIEVTGGKLTITGAGSVADSDGSTGGTIQIDGGAVLDLNAPDTQNVSFTGTGGELQIDTASFGGHIIGLAATDQIELTTIGYGLGTTATYVSNADNTGGTLTVTDGHDSIALQLVGDYRDAHFAGSADGNGTLITVNADDDAPAFAPGEATPAATVAEVADITGSPATDDSTPAGGAIHFTDIDLTDRPTATVTQTVTWTGGTLTGDEQSALASAFHLTQPVANTNNGEIDWTYSITDSSLDFLGANQTATVTSTITLDDHQSGLDTATVTVTIDGANDVPTIAATGGSLTEAPNVTGSGATDPASGAITFSDADITDHPTVTTSFASFDYKDAQGDDLTLTLTPDQQAAVAALETDLTLSANSGNANNGSYGWSYSVTDSALDFMAAGDKLVLTYNATVDDGHAGGTATTPVTVTITGSDDAPTLGFTQDVPVSTDENHAVTIDGITVNDVDAGNSQIEVTVAAGHGSLALSDATGLDSTHTNSDGSIDLFGSQAAINTALSHGVIYTPAADFSGADALTVTANDQVSAALGGPLTGSEQIAVNVEPGTPDFTAMTLNIAQGATVVLADANFSISDPDTAHFLYTVNNVTGGQFEVQHDGTWMPAPTGGFTTQQVEAGQVEFVQDGTDTTPGFTIFATDGTNASATIAPTVGFTPTPPVAHDDVLSGPSGSGWMLDTDNGHYYREVATFGSFETAVENSAADGGYLATITSAAEQSFVVNHVIDGFSATWLGGETNNDRPDGSTVNESVWSWVTGPEAGTQFTYTNWNPGEPSGGFEATTQWLQIGPTGGWNDAPDAGQLGDGQGAGYLEEWGGTPTQVSFIENTGTAIDTSVLLANDIDIDGLPLTVTAVGDSNGHSAHGGSVSLTGNVITYTPSTDYSGADSFSYTISDGTSTSTATVSFEVAADVAPVLNSMTLTVAQGGVEVLGDANFSVTDPDSASFVFTANNVTSGQFDVFDGTHWAQASDFTTAQIEAGHVEFVQDGTATAPDFSISVSDGISASAAIAPTVDFIQPHALAPANLIVNGGFETNDYTGWTIGGVVATPDSVVVGPSEFSFSNDAPHTGVHEALIGSQPEEVTLSQTVATTAGEHYTVDFWIMQDQPPIGSDDFSASWNGTTLTSLVDVGQQSGYTEYQFDVTGAAGSGSSTLAFSAGNTGYWDIDDVSVLHGAPTTVQEMSDTTTAVAGVNATDTLTVTPPANAIGSVTATAGNGTVGWQFEATNAQLDHLMGMTQSFTVADQNNPAVSQTVAVSVGGNGNDQFVFHAGVGADTMVNFSTLTTAQGAYAGDTIELANFTGITSPSDVLNHLSADSHGNAVVDLGNHDSITFQGLSVAQIQANASHIFHV